MNESTDIPEFKLSFKYGHSVARAWIEIEMTPCGFARLIGMGSRTDIDQNGKITAHKVGPTGLVGVVW